MWDKGRQKDVLAVLDMISYYACSKLRFQALGGWGGELQYPMSVCNNETRWLGLASSATTDLKSQALCWPQLRRANISILYQNNTAATAAPVKTQTSSLVLSVFGASKNSTTPCATPLILEIAFSHNYSLA